MKIVLVMIVIIVMNMQCIVVVYGLIDSISDYIYPLQEYQLLIDSSRNLLEMLNTLLALYLLVKIKKLKG